MSQTSRSTVRRTVREYAEAGCQRGDLVSAVAEDCDVVPEHVEEELDELERHGFVYIVSGEVRLP